MVELHTSASSCAVCDDVASDDSAPLEDCTDDSARASEDLRPSCRQLELRREQRPTARETDARFRLNHEPSCESPPVA